MIYQTISKIFWQITDVFFFCYLSISAVISSNLPDFPLFIASISIVASSSVAGLALTSRGSSVVLMSGECLGSGLLSTASKFSFSYLTQALYIYTKCIFTCLLEGAAFSTDNLCYFVNIPYNLFSWCCCFVSNLQKFFCLINQVTWHHYQTSTHNQSKTLTRNPPENCHLNVKKLAIFQKNANNCIFSKN